jgi:2-succinyl-5-enolpyruvyl-6-hydroxy-3-cyclohexene-1-carboxylate synthase
VNRNALWSQVLVDELARCGVGHVAICPGSRSAPLALAFDQHPNFEVTTHTDERGAAFFALGRARRSGVPSVVLTTSGSAVANLLPAVVEADHAGVPLILLTADRPHELRGVGANQAIHQPGLLRVGFEVDLPEPELQAAVVRYLRQTVCRAVAHATRGPVHLNQPLREPLHPDESEAARVAEFAAAHPEVEGRPQGAPWTRHSPSAPSPRDHEVQALAGLLDGPGVLVCGPMNEDASASIHALAERLDAPVLADPLSHCRHAHDAISTYDAFLAVESVAAQLVPQWVLCFGATPTSKPLRRWLERHGATHIVVDGLGRGWDDTHGATHMVHAPAGLLAELLKRHLPAPSRSWRATWQALDDRTAHAHLQAAAEGDWEGAVASHLVAGLPTDALLWSASSLAIRDIDRFGLARSDPLTIQANRGTSGIDGALHAAAGAASVHEGPAVALVGDQAFLHDLNGLAALRYAPNLTVIVVHNGGGQVFRHLPLARSIDADTYERLFAAPQGMDVAAAAQAFGLEHREATPEELRALAPNPPGGILSVRFDGAAAAARRQAIQNTLSDSLHATLP